MRGRQGRGAGVESRVRSTEDKMPSYVTTIKADAQRCEPDPCGGQRTTGCSAAVCKTCGFSEAWDFPSNKISSKGALAGKARSPFTHTHQRKILLGYVGPVKAKWIIGLGCGGATGECLVCTSKQGYKTLIRSWGFLKDKISPAGELFNYMSTIKVVPDKKKRIFMLSIWMVYGLISGKQF